MLSSLSGRFPHREEGVFGGVVPQSEISLQNLGRHCAGVSGVVFSLLFIAHLSSKSSTHPHLIGDHTYSPHPHETKRLILSGIFFTGIFVSFVMWIRCRTQEPVLATIDHPVPGVVVDEV